MSYPTFHVKSASGDRVSLLNHLDVEPRDALQSYIPLHRGDPERTLSTPQHLKRNQCALCHKTFSTSGHLTRHLTMHSGAKTYKCPFPKCPARCSRHDNLQQHFATHLSPAERKRGHTYVRRALTTMMASESVPVAKVPQAPLLRLAPSKLSHSNDDASVLNPTPGTPDVLTPSFDHDVHTTPFSPHAHIRPIPPYTSPLLVSMPLSLATVEEASAVRPHARQRAPAMPSPRRTANSARGFEVSFLRTECD